MGRMRKISDGSVDGMKVLTMSGGGGESYTWHIDGPMCSVVIFDPDPLGTAYDGVVQILGSHDGTNFAPLNNAIGSAGVYQITSPIPYIKILDDGTGGNGNATASIVEWID